MDYNAAHQGACQIAEYGLIDEALPYFKLARDLNPTDPYSQSEYAYSLHFTHTAPEVQFAENRRYAELFEPWGRIEMPPHPPKANGKIRLGYLSPDFFNHTSHSLNEPILHYHDKSQFELYLYYTNNKFDEHTEIIKKYADVWRTIEAQETDQLVEQIRKDKIDILIDLAGHTSRHSLPVFAKRAAPIQMSWYGYMDSTGLANMD